MKILIIDGYGGYNRPFKGIGEIVEDTTVFLKSPKKFGLVVFTGGEDVCPALYGETSPLNMCGFNARRDVREQALYEIARENNIPMTGICRGSQFLNVMAGGTLMHHISHHGSKHSTKTSDGCVMDVTSTHHQMCLPSKEGYVLAWSEIRRSTVYYGDKDQRVSYNGPEVESIYYPDYKIFAVQYHPEYMNEKSEGLLWYKEGVRSLLHLSKEEFKLKYLKKAKTAVAR